MKKGTWLSSLSLWATTQMAVCLILRLLIFIKQIQEKKEEIWLITMTWQHKIAIKNFDYTIISDRLRMVSWINDSFPTGEVKPVYGIPTFPPKWIKTKRNFSAAVSIMIFQFQL